jgi:transposase
MGLTTIGPWLAEAIIANLGIDMGRFASGAYKASWARLALGQAESAGKQGSSRIGKGNRYLRAR